MHYSYCNTSAFLISKTLYYFKGACGMGTMVASQRKSELFQANGKSAAADDIMASMMEELCCVSPTAISIGRCKNIMKIESWLHTS
jgi:hypothetical protein